MQDIFVIAILSYFLAASSCAANQNIISRSYEPRQKHNPRYYGQRSEPPFGGTIFIEPSIIDSNDVSILESTIYVGQECRSLYDRRTGSWNDVEAYNFVVTFSDNIKSEFQVHSEFESSDNAEGFVDTYARHLGRIPAFLRRGVRVVQILKGNNAWGGGGNTLTIHTEQGDDYISHGIAEEAMIHEAAHARVDLHNDIWNQAVEADDTYISTYARDFPDREDLAESLLGWIGVGYRGERLSSEDSNAIYSSIANRMSFFEWQNYDMYPLSGDEGSYDGSYGGQKCSLRETESISSCFSPSAKADVLGKGKVLMKDLIAGDSVLTASGNYETIFTIDHFHPSMPTVFVQIHTSLDENPLELTPRHLLFVEGLSYSVPASNVQVGYMVKSIKGPVEVTKVVMITRNGLYNPVTTDGTIIVDGIFASTYASPSDSSHLEIASTKLLPYQTIIDIASTPYRAFCMGISLDLCNQHDELASTSKAMQQLYIFWSQQNNFSSFFVFLVSLLTFGPITLVLNFHTTTAILASFVLISGCDVVKKKEKWRTS